MALIRCLECGKEVSDKADKCPNCGYPISENSYKNLCEEKVLEVDSSFELNGVKLDIKEIQRRSFFKKVKNISKKVRKYCSCDKEKADEIVYGYFLATHGEISENQHDLMEKISYIKSWKGSQFFCPYCLSRNIDEKETVYESTTKGKSEVRKKSAVTRAGNSAGRKTMIAMTGGLWALTPKKSKYNEVQESKTQYNKIITKRCMDCGRTLT